MRGVRFGVFSGFVILVLTGLCPAQESTATADQSSTAPRPNGRNVILVTADGLRWQEVFRGASQDLMTTANKVTDDVKPMVLSEYDADTTQGRREKLMPFLWGTVAKQGTLWGNQDLGCMAQVQNGWWFSYPGYNELLTGRPDDGRIRSNHGIPNPNVTVFEWLHTSDALRGKVVGVGAWNIFPQIFNSGRGGFPVDGGDRPFSPQAGLTPGMEMINTIRQTTPYRWKGACFDSFVFPMFKEYLVANRPRVAFLGLGETDEWGHESDYAHYLEAARRTDSWLKELWETVQSLPEYKDNTTIIFTCDHGRGDIDQGETAWSNHGRKWIGSDGIFVAMWGPDVPARGEVKDEAIKQGQVAATVAWALGCDFPAAYPQAAPPLFNAEK